MPTAGHPLLIASPHPGDYYPSLFFSELGKLKAELIPKFTQAYYIHSEFDSG